MAGLLGGPAVLGVVVLLGYARKVLGSSVRDPRAGWRTFGIGILLLVWFIIFLLLSTPWVIQSWMADGNVEPGYVALTASWLMGIGLLVAVGWNARRTANYLSESYRTGEWPPLVRLLRWLFRL